MSCDEDLVQKSTFRRLIQRVEDLAKAFGDELRRRTMKDGGTINQVPMKNSSTNLDWDWKTILISHVSGLPAQVTRIDNIEAELPLKANKLVVFGVKAGASMDLATGDAFIWTDLSHTSDAVFNVPSGITLDNGTPFTYFNNGDYNITIVPAGGVVIKYFATLVISPGQTFQLIKRSNNNYRLIG